ncbi:hypothetical protein S7711_10992 [Stachybotrys chartarum IBT 7711]|uniref:Uncharacterized protein n=1 Tax=Stachybotrys chartarum (strain CBS 109288 / IBT 7711) TaxID=1280523 RepID=A0A084AKP5_STACB|nr:hypothetical protein S7711_10992 [Stachybotrys chartarum IBT 7711]KFA51550.1 hypothetical protein S40293_11066 [Stachybotrys chartarum IBT 40293]
MRDTESPTSQTIWRVERKVGARSTHGDLPAAVEGSTGRNDKNACEATRQRQARCRVPQHLGVGAAGPTGRQGFCVDGPGPPCIAPAHGAPQLRDLLQKPYRKRTLAPYCIAIRAEHVETTRYGRSTCAKVSDSVGIDSERRDKTLLAYRRKRSTSKAAGAGVASPFVRAGAHANHASLLAPLQTPVWGSADSEETCLLVV